MAAGSVSGRLVPAAAVVAVVVAGCAVASPIQTDTPMASSNPSDVAAVSATPASVSTEPNRPGLPSSTPAIVAKSVDIGDGRSLYLVCRGEGSPTVLFESGDTGDVRGWDPVAPGIARVTRACAYDRAGVGRSSEATGCRRLPEILGDLDALLEAADVTGPFILVAASGGGHIASAFARRHREEVAGMVFLDVPAPVSTPDWPPPWLVAELKCDHPDNIERRDYLHVEKDAWDNRAEIGDIPITIMSVDYGDNPPDPGAIGQVEKQRGWLAMSPRAEQLVVTHTGHNIVWDDPTLVIREVLKIVEASRGG